MTTDAIFQLSDLHLGSVVKPGQVSGWNSFHRDIAVERLEILGDNLATTLRKLHHKWGTFHLVLGGDFVHGERHERETNDLTLEDQRAEAVYQLRDWIGRLQTLLADLGMPLEIHAVMGNHGEVEPGKLPTKDSYGRNIEWGIYRELADNTSPGNSLVSVIWNIADGVSTTFRCQGLRFQVIHGHFLGPRTAALSSIEKAVERRMQQATSADEPFDHLLVHHFHRPLTHPDFTVNGCICGFDELAMARGWPWAPPTQVLTLVHPWWGIYQRNIIHATAEGSSRV